MEILPVKNPFGAPVYHTGTVSSTMDTVRELAGRNEPHGTVIAADFQEAGRGRLNRSWQVNYGENLIFSMLFRYGNTIPKAFVLRTGLAVSLAVEDFVPSLAGLVKVKWPNDIMIDSRKAAGILTESDGKNVYAGIGINYAQKEFPGELSSKAVSLIQVCPGLEKNNRFILLEKILFRLHEELEKCGDETLWHENLSGRLYKKGEKVTFMEGAPDSNRFIKGTLLGIGPGGELLIVPEGEKSAVSFVTGELRVYLEIKV